MGHYFKWLGSKEQARTLWENREALNLYLHRLRELMTDGKKLFELTPVQCVEIPHDLEDGKLYISKEYETVIHLCACGCGGKTVTPFCKGEWKLDDNDGKITLRPSIGNWAGENPYHAHYHITENKVEWL